MEWSKHEAEEAKVELRKLLSPGDTVYCILRHVSRSGMFRRISPVVILPGYDKKPVVRDLSWLVGKAINSPTYYDKEGVGMSGCGMDMGFHLVYCLGRALWPEGFKVKGRGRNGDTSGWDKDGGYALRKEWL